MVGREAYHNPWLMAGWDAAFYGDDSTAVSRQQVVDAMLPYIRARLAEGHKLRNIARHILGCSRACRVHASGGACCPMPSSGWCRRRPAAAGTGCHASRNEHTE
jgi:tRNA-dihydrouridine synthase